jgi:hypothetical protein
MSIPLFISAVILGFLLGVLLCYSVAQGRQHRTGRKPDIDRLTAQFQELFRQIDRDKHQRL